MKFMKSLCTLLFVFSLSVMYAQQTLPSVSVKKLDGQSVDVTNVASDSKLRIISFWATWCSPCKKELDAVADLYPEWQEKYNVELLAVSIDTRRAQAKIGPMVESKGWEYTVLVDANQDLKNALNVQAVPHTFIIDENNNVVYSHPGYVPGDEYELEEKIIELAGR